MNKIANLQDAFLNTLRKEKVQVTVFMTNGFQNKGVITGYDNFVVLMMDANGHQQMIFKHAISTIAPQKNVTLDLKSISEEEE